MNIKKVAGACLLILGIATVVHAFYIVSTGRGEPGYLFILVTALLFIVGVTLLRKSSQRAEGPSTRED